MVVAMPKRKKRNDLVVKMDADVVRLGRLVAADKGLPLAEVLSEFLRPVLEREVAKIDLLPKSDDDKPPRKPRA